MILFKFIYINKINSQTPALFVRIFLKIGYNHTDRQISSVDYKITDSKREMALKDTKSPYKYCVNFRIRCLSNTLPDQ